MKRAILALLLVSMLSITAFATASWETGRMPYKPSLPGKVCWTTMREYKEDDRREAIFHSMDLSTGEINTEQLDDWYLIQTDLSQNGTLIARHSDGLLQIAQYSLKGEWEPFLEYPYDNAYTNWDAATQLNYSRSVIAYIDGFLYYMMSDGSREWVRRDDMNGNVHDYATGYQTTIISPGGNLNGSDFDHNKVIETADGSVFIIGRNSEKNRSYFPIAWIDDERLLLWARELDENRKQYLYEYSYADDKFTPVCNDAGEHILSVEGSSGYATSLHPSNDQIVQLVYWAEDYFSVPTVLSKKTGLPVFIAETEHTDSYDEYCTSSDRVIWLIAG